MQEAVKGHAEKDTAMQDHVFLHQLSVSSSAIGVFQPPGQFSPQTTGLFPMNPNINACHVY